ncbi:MAG: hypothetical protein ACYDCL_15845 [Myxococcales bacterium]
MKRWLCVMLLALPSVALATGPDVPEANLPDAQADVPDERPMAEPPATISHWTDAHPAASFSLVAWVQKSPTTAKQIFWWDRRHPLRAGAFLRWAIKHPNGTLDEFSSAHQSWPAIHLVIEPNREGLQDLLVWARAHPSAVQDLISTRRGFAWVGFHPMRSLWDPSAVETANPSQK